MKDKKFKKTATSDILAYMESGNFITAEIAESKFGVHRLSAIIFELRKKYNIKTVMVDCKTRYGKTCKYARYFLEK